MTTTTRRRHARTDADVTLLVHCIDSRPLEHLESPQRYFSRCKFHLCCEVREGKNCWSSLCGWCVALCGACFPSGGWLWGLALPSRLLAAACHGRGYILWCPRASPGFDGWLQIIREEFETEDQAIDGEKARLRAIGRSKTQARELWCKCGSYQAGL